MRCSLQINKKQYVYHVYLFYVTAVQIDKYYKQKVRKKEYLIWTAIRTKKNKG